MPTPKKRNPTDLTTRNLARSRKTDQSQAEAIRELKRRVAAIEKYLGIKTPRWYKRPKPIGANRSAK